MIIQMRVGAGGIRQCCRGDANGGEAGEQQYIGKDLAYASVCLTSLPSNDRNPETEPKNLVFSLRLLFFLFRLLK